MRLIPNYPSADWDVGETMKRQNDEVQNNYGFPVKGKACNLTHGLESWKIKTGNESDA